MSAAREGLRAALATYGIDTAELLTVRLSNGGQHVQNRCYCNIDLACRGVHLFERKCKIDAD